MRHGRVNRAVEVVPLAPDRATLRVLIDPGSVPEATPEVERAWRELRSRNPRLFNGEILSVREIDAGRGEIRCRRDTYQRLAVQHMVEAGVEQLAVNGVLVARDRAGREHVLLGRRGHGTRMYGGLWEVGPAGGIDPPGPGVDRIEHAGLVAQLAREVHEEANLDRAVEEARAVAVVYDGIARSYDIVLRVDLPGVLDDPGSPPRPRQWEYEELRWVAVAEVRGFARAHEGEMVGATRAILGFLGWA